MAFKDAMAALNMEFSAKIPRTEYSAHRHWKLVKEVTGIDTDITENREQASQEFIKAWDYSFMWSVSIGSGVMEEKGGRITKLGHAEYGENANGKSDFSNTVSNPFPTVEDAYNLDIFEEYGEFSEAEIIEKFENDYRLQQQKYPNALNTAGIYVTMFSGLIDIFGWDTLLMAMGTDEKRFGKVIDGYTHWIKQFFDGFAKCNVPVMMVHDDLCWTSGPVCSPIWYRKYIFPKIDKLLQPVREAGKMIMFTSDGTIDEFFGDIVNLGVSTVVMEPSCNMELFAESYGSRVGFVGGIDCRTLTFGSNEEIKQQMEKVMAWGRKYPGFMLAVGNHLPANVPVDKALYYNELYEKLAYR